MKPSEIERRIAALESRQSGKFESSVILELPEKAYQPIYPPTPAKRLFRELPDCPDSTRAGELATIKVATATPAPRGR